MFIAGRKVPTQLVVFFCCVQLSHLFLCSSSHSLLGRDARLSKMFINCGEQNHCLFQGLPVTSDPVIYWQWHCMRGLYWLAQRKDISFHPSGAPCSPPVLEMTKSLLPLFTFYNELIETCFFFQTSQLVDLQSLWCWGDATSVVLFGQKID